MNNETLATELLKEQKQNAKRWSVAFLVVLCLWFATIAGFIIYLSLPEEVTQTTVEQQSSGDFHDNNNIIGGDYYSQPSEDNSYSNPTEQAP